MEQIEDISWRYFLVLVNNLSPYGAVAQQIKLSYNKPDGGDEQSDEEAANAFFAAVVSV